MQGERRGRTGEGPQGSGVREPGGGREGIRPEGGDQDRSPPQRQEISGGGRAGGGIGGEGAVKKGKTLERKDAKGSPAKLTTARAILDMPGMEEALLRALEERGYRLAGPEKRRGTSTK